METLTGKSYLERLPAELKMMIMQHLTQNDLCNVALVSKNLKSVALDPSLWTQITITSDQHNFMMKKIHLLRFKKIKLFKIKSKLSGVRQNIVWNSKQIAPILKETVQFKSLVELDLGDTALLGISAKLLSETITKLKKVNLFRTELSTEQVVAICEEIIKSKSIAELALGENNLKDVPKGLLSKAITKLGKVGLSYTHLSTEQLVAIFEETIKSNSLKELDLKFNSERNVPTELLSKAITKLEKADLSASLLSTEQLMAIFEETIKSNSLTELNIPYNNLKDVPTEVLSKAITKLKKCDLVKTHLSTEQLVAILEETIKSNSLTQLNLGRNFLKVVPTKLISKAITKLEKAYLTTTNLSTVQVVAILEETIISNSITELDLGKTNLKDVSAGLLSKAITKLEKAGLSNTHLSTEQLVAIFEETIKSNSLKELDLRPYSGFKYVPKETKEIIRKSISKLTKTSIIKKTQFPKKKAE